MFTAQCPVFDRIQEQPGGVCDPVVGHRTMLDEDLHQSIGQDDLIGRLSAVFFSNPETIRTTCIDDRAIAIDLIHDEADRGRKIARPMLVLWAGNMARRPGWQTGGKLDMIGSWQERAGNIRGRALDCGHFLAEEAPDETAREILAFLSDC